MAYQTTAELLEDLLFRAGEPVDGTSDFKDAALRYLNRAQQALALGGAEFEPSIQEDWWWLRKSPPGVVTLAPVYATGTVTVANASPIVTFSVAPPTTRAGDFFAVDGDSTRYRVTSHTAGAATALLDSPYTGLDAVGVAFRLVRLEYALATDVLRVLSPMFGYAYNYLPCRIELVPVDTFREQWPTALWEDGPLDAFAMVAEQTVRFNRAGGPLATDSLRVEYDYLISPPALTNAAGEEPLVPLQWRRLLSDAALFFLFMDKNDNRTDGTGLLLIKGLRAMARENHHKQVSQSNEVGKIRPRPDEPAVLTVVRP